MNDGYIHTVLVGLDSFAAVLFFCRADLTISTMCWMVANGKGGYLKLNRFQLWFLRWLGPVLNKIQTDHMAIAQASDLARANSTIAAIGSPDALTTLTAP